MALWTASKALKTFHGQVLLEGKDLLRQCYRVDDGRKEAPVPFRLSERITRDEPYFAVKKRIVMSKWRRRRQCKT